MENRDKIIALLYSFIAQKPGFDPRNYGDFKLYRAEMRSVTRDRKDAEILLRQVELKKESISEQALRDAFRAFSGRLSIVEEGCQHGDAFKVACGANPKHVWCEKCDPAPAALCHFCHGRGHTIAKPYGMRLDYCTGQYFPTEYRKAVCAVLASALWQAKRDNMVPSGEGPTNAGDVIRKQFRREFGARMQRIWFD